MKEQKKHDNVSQICSNCHCMNKLKEPEELIEKTCTSSLFHEETHTV